MSRDFTPDFDDFREASRSSRESPRPSRDTRPATTRTREEIPHPEPRFRDVREPRPKEVPPRDSRDVLYDRYRGYDLRESEIQTLTDLGKFRVVNAEDLARHGYGGDSGRMERETESLVRQGLVEEKRVEVSLSKSTWMYTLTKAGRRLMRGSGRLPHDQEIYSGFVKPREAKHDAELYRVYQREEDRIERRGGRVRRVLLDFELKKKVNRDLTLLGPQKDDPDKKHDVAERHGLRVVHGRIPVPDLQIEYEMPDQSIARVNLELTTGDYRPRQLADKARAGFTLYSHGDDASHVRRVLSDRELTAEILSL
jgi:DNA-binding MarR family transcriptional regulator